jgi:glycosyltransferase involved in cell wall biosynthesis
VIRRRVLLVQPSIEPPGGGNAVACWMIEALKADHDVTLLTRALPNLQRANLVCGTSLGSGDFRIEIVPSTASRLAALAPPVTGLALLRDHRMLAYARRRAARFDVVITAHNESDLGRRGIQYVHFPKLDPRRPDLGLRWYQRRPVLVAAYHRACAAATGFSYARMRSNVTLVNSAWTGALVRRLHGIEPLTLYPPAAGDFPPVAWEAREPGFGCVGRIAPEKRIDAVIDILARVRRAHPDVTLTIAGNVDDAGYLDRVRAAARAHGEWVSFELDVPRDRLLRLLATRRYGIHGMQNEHFGMAVAELVCAGTIVFAHASGGQTEILAGDSRLLYVNDDDAVEKIGRVLGDPVLAAELRTSLAAGAERFSSARFVRGFREVVAGV